VLVSAHDGAVDHHIFVIVIASQFLENAIKNARLGPPVEALINNLPIAKTLGEITPRNPGSKSEQHRLDEEAIISCGAADVTFLARQKILDPLPLVVA
jgi:hypothetical protein